MAKFSGIAYEPHPVSPERKAELRAKGLKIIDVIFAPEGERSEVSTESSLREDGPTVAEYVDAGYLASHYPPEGYASRSTPEEIASAVAAQTGDNKPGLVDGDTFSDDQLREMIKEATGKAPHHKLSREKLIAMFNEANTAASE